MSGQFQIPGQKVVSKFGSSGLNLFWSRGKKLVQEEDREQWAGGSWLNFQIRPKLVDFLCTSNQGYRPMKCIVGKGKLLIYIQQNVLSKITQTILQVFSESRSHLVGVWGEMGDGLLDRVLHLVPLLLVRAVIFRISFISYQIYAIVFCLGLLILFLHIFSVPNCHWIRSTGSLLFVLSVQTNNNYLI